jgi:hypothetical protein
VRRARVCAGLLGIAFLGGCGADAPAPAAPDAVQRSAAVAPAPAAPAPPAAAAPGAPAAPAAPTPPAATAALGEPGFWHLVEQARRDAGGDTERQSELLAERLGTLPAAQIADFGAIRRRLDAQAYTWDLWGAAYVIEDGCSDDCFRDFRAYLIALGRAPYQAALKDPDSLAPVVQDAEAGDWENADDPAPEAYEDATGEELPGGDGDLSGPPRGSAWDDEQADELQQRYPALAARFR